LLYNKLKVRLMHTITGGNRVDSDFHKLLTLMVMQPAQIVTRGVMYFNTTLCMCVCVCVSVSVCVGGEGVVGVGL